MAIQLVRDYFKKFDMEDKILEFDVSSATVELAAIALSCIPARIAKTMSFKLENSCALIVTAGDVKIDNQKFKAFFHSKAKMLTADEVVEYTNHAIGGVCPFAITNSDVKVYLDNSLLRFDTVFPACGSSNSAIELTIEQLKLYSNCVEMIDVCKEKEAV